jgi:hypothetical protein
MAMRLPRLAVMVEAGPAGSRPTGVLLAPVVLALCAVGANAMSALVARVTVALK